MVVVEDKQSGKVVGFLEIGMLPKPTSSEERSLDESTLAETAATAVAASVSAAAATATAQAAGEEGSPASDGERDETSEESGELDVSHDSVGSTAIERSPDVSYLANVVVDRSQRRRGIGRTMVNSALEIVRELWPEEERIYVSVEQASKRREGRDFVVVCDRGAYWFAGLAIIAYPLPILSSTVLDGP